jgi:cytochrome c biogenesis protein CcmG/thiol:disulfide interchange protein DsbE
VPRILLALILLSLILGFAACGTGNPPEPITPPLPEIDLAGFQQLLTQLDQPAIVNVWASWCLPCRAEAPLFQTAHRQHSPQIAFLGIDYDDSQRGARLFLDQFDLPFPHYYDPDGVTIAHYGGIGVPRTYFFTSNDQLIYTHNGAIDQATLALHIDELLNR